MSPDGRTASPPPDRERGNLSRWCIEHPYVIIAFYLGVALLAVIVIVFQMPRRMMPYVESPIVAVVSMMPGLSAEEMEIYFSKPIEERMVDLKNVHFVRSTSQEGFSVVSVEFWYGTDMKKALFDVQSLMNVVQADLPMTGANLKPSWVLAIDPLNIPILSLAVTGDGYDPVQLRTLVENEIVNRLKVVKDVYSVVPFGGQKLQMQVVVDRERLAAYRMSLLDLKNTLDMQNQSRPAGTLTYQDREVVVRSDVRARGPEEVAAYPIASMDGRTVYLRDVAEVINAPREQRSLYRFNGKEAVEVSIIQQPDASSVRVIEAVKARLAEIQADHPGLRFEIAYDNATFVGFLMDNMIEELGMAVFLTGLAVLLFLGNVRATVIALITLPMSLAISLLAMVPLGMTLNSSTLIGLLLSVGRLVDDSIIDVHSIERHLRMGKSPKDAAVDGITEVQLAVLAIAFMLCVALLPLVFSGGIVQLMFEGDRLDHDPGPARLRARGLHPGAAPRRLPVHPAQRRARSAAVAIPAVAARSLPARAGARRGRLPNEPGVVPAQPGGRPGCGDRHHSGGGGPVSTDRQRDDAAGGRLPSFRPAGGRAGDLLRADVGDRGRGRAAADAAARDREGVVRDRLRARRDVLHGLRHGLGERRLHDDHPRRSVGAPSRHLAGHRRRT
jgi:AcrB/AcrD/AcrF family